MQPIIVIGDKTSHGGTVITASPFADTHGKGWARIGDMVSCPKCKGIFPICEGDSTLTDDGKPVAYHGCKVACGAKLIAAQMFTFTQPGSAAGSGQDSAMTKTAHTKKGPIGTGMVAGYEEEPIEEAHHRFRGRFQVIDAVSGEPIVGQASRLRSTGGQYVNTTTDVDGFTKWFERDASEFLAFDIDDQERA